MDVKPYSRGTIIFKEGESGDCLYEIENGCVGIYKDYGGPNEKKVAHLMPTDIFGEMALLDSAPRSATAVVLENDTILTRVAEEDFNEYFAQGKAKILQVLLQLCSRLRNTTQDYLNACRTVHETVEAEKNGTAKSESLLDKIKKFCDLYGSFNFYGDV